MLCLKKQNGNEKHMQTSTTLRQPTGTSLIANFAAGTYTPEQIERFLGDAKVKLHRITQERDGSHTIVIGACKGIAGNFELEMAYARLEKRGARMIELFESYAEDLPQL